MVLEKQSKVLVLVPFQPKCAFLVQDLFWYSIRPDEYMNYFCVIQFKKIKYHCISGTVETNQKLNDVKSGISQLDLKDGFENKNSGCLINFGLDDEQDNIYKLITWSMVLHGKTDGIQVWTKRKDFRNLSTAFNNRKKTNDGLISFLNTMYLEMFGDRMQCLYLLSCFYRTQIKQKQIKNKMTNANSNSNERFFEGESYHRLINEIDLTFKNAIIETYKSFCILGEPLVSSQEID
jgi:hypothetical protein